MSANQRDQEKFSERSRERLYIYIFIRKEKNILTYCPSNKFFYPLPLTVITSGLMTKTLDNPRDTGKEKLRKQTKRELLFALLFLLAAFEYKLWALLLFIGATNDSIIYVHTQQLICAIALAKKN
jgi:hypothetical protein